MEETALSIDASDDAHSPAPYVARAQALPSDRLIPQSLSDMADTAVCKLEQFCYAQFQIATDPAEKGDWIHNVAACMVELHRRGLPLGGGVA